MSINFLLVITALFFAVLALRGFYKGLIPTKFIKIPKLHGLNCFLGMLLRLLIGLLILSLFFALVRVFEDTAFASLIMPDIRRSNFLSYIYDHNLLFVFLVIVL